MNISTLNNLDGDIWKMILEDLYVAEKQETETLDATGADVTAEQATTSGAGHSASREKG
jgi:hypothetical protein